MRPGRWNRTRACAESRNTRPPDGDTGARVEVPDPALLSHPLDVDSPAELAEQFRHLIVAAFDGLHALNRGPASS